MQLSIIIVNYNVKYFLEQCLSSVQKSIEGIDAEVIVVDNDSNDGSIGYLQPLFPRVKFIESKINLGFAKANNLALQLAKGNYILFLNPDTIIPENCIVNCLNFFSQHNDCGALGVQMIDGSGNFLPESKRSFPSLTAAFFKLTGLSQLFPKSKFFNQYALGHLSKNENYEVDVLAGAFMMMSRSALVQTNGFDETFFMYGEDIDLSYRIQKIGYKNYYFGKQTIIHFKGESTKRGSLNFVKMFYNAMTIFIKKHYRGSKATLFSTSINFAIWIRAFISIIQNFLSKSGMLIIDAMVVYAVLFFTKMFWVEIVRDGFPFDGDFEPYAIPIYTIIFIISAQLSGIYDNLYKPLKALIASATAVIVLLAFYSLLPETYRFSRGVILSGGILAGLMVTFIRWLFVKVGLIKADEVLTNKKTIVVGAAIENIQVLQLLSKTAVKERIVGRVGIKDDDFEQSLGNIHDLKKITKQIGVNEIIFCEGLLKFEQIIEEIDDLKNNKISFKFHAKKSHSIVGSDSKTSSGETFSIDGDYALSNPYQQRMKRMVDVWLAAIILITFPLQFVLIKNGNTALKNAWKVFIGRKTWVGYSAYQNTLPLIATGILLPSGYPMSEVDKLNKPLLRKSDLIYAKEYDWMHDIKIIMENYKYLGGD